jgi:ABC-type nitrate/sulfonate/bicarbonate transport system permease component
MESVSVSAVPVRTKVIAHIALGVLVIAAWGAASTWFADPFWIPKPSVIVASLWTEIVEGDMLGHTTITPHHAVTGLTSSLIFGVQIGVQFAARPFIQRSRRCLF